MSRRAERGNAGSRSSKREPSKSREPTESLACGEPRAEPMYTLAGGRGRQGVHDRERLFQLLVRAAARTVYSYRVFIPCIQTGVSARLDGASLSARWNQKMLE